MTNSLIKNTTIEVVVGLEVVPAQPYIPPSPPRTVYETRYVCGFLHPNEAGHYVYVTTEGGGVTAIWVPDGGTPGLVSTWGCWNQLVPVTYPGDPGQPYVPSHTALGEIPTTGYNLGWNAGGRSITMFTADGFVQFQARASAVGIIAGINVYDGVDAHYSGTTTDYAFYLTHGVARIMENGVIGAYAGTYTDATVFKIDRTGTTITYYMNGVSKGTTAGALTAPGWLEASLYSGDDEVFNPVVTQVSAPDLTTLDATLDGVLPELTFFGTDGVYAELSGELSALTAEMSSGAVVPDYAIGDWQLPPLAMDANGLTGEKGTLAGTLLGLRMLAADHPYAEMNASLPPLDGGMSAFEGNLNASMAGYAVGTTSMESFNFLVVTMTSNGVITTSMVTSALVSAQMVSQASLGSTFAIKQVLQVVMTSIGESVGSLDDLDTDHETWVINIDTPASTTYTNYGFNSFAFSGGRYYGAGPDGIFQLDGDTDAGAPIRAYMHLGKRDFGTRTKKTIYNAYVGMSASGNLFIKLLTDVGNFIYRVRDFDPALQQQRFTFGKGLRSNYVEIELFNENGADFELDTVQFIVADLTRNI